MKRVKAKPLEVGEFVSCMSGKFAFNAEILGIRHNANGLSNYRTFWVVIPPDNVDHMEKGTCHRINLWKDLRTSVEIPRAKISASRHYVDLPKRNLKRLDPLHLAEMEIRKEIFGEKLKPIKVKAKKVLETFEAF